jgi:hypothetical protein
MGVLLQAFYQRGDRGVSCPLDGDPGPAQLPSLATDNKLLQAHTKADHHNPSSPDTA